MSIIHQLLRVMYPRTRSYLRAGNQHALSLLIGLLLVGPRGTLCWVSSSGMKLATCAGQARHHVEVL